MGTLSTRLPNPIWNALYFLTGKCYAFTEFERRSNENCKILRDIIRQYVKKRVSGEVKSQVSSQSDILSLFLQQPEVFTEEVIIDEVCDFLVAGTKTTWITT